MESWLTQWGGKAFESRVSLRATGRCDKPTQPAPICFNEKRADDGSTVRTFLLPKWLYGCYLASNLSNKPAVQYSMRLESRLRAQLNAKKEMDQWITSELSNIRLQHELHQKVNSVVQTALHCSHVYLLSVETYAVNTSIKHLQFISHSNKAHIGSRCLIKYFKAVAETYAFV